MSKKSYTYLVTGAAGFIGSRLCRALLEDEHTASIIGIDNINNYYKHEIKQRRIKELSKNGRFIFYKTSILEKKNLFNIVTRHKPTILIHTAAEVGVRNGEVHPVEYFSTNVLGTLNILEATAPFMRHAIVFSSSSIYGSTKHLPFRESEPIFPSTPLSTYGASKFAMEIATRNFFLRTNLPITIVRPFSIYGPDGRPDMLPMKLLISAYTQTPISLYAPESTWRDWTYIDDFVSSVLALLAKPDGLRIVNIGSGKPMRLDTTIEIAKRVLTKFGRRLQYTIKPYNPTEMRKTWADTSRLTRVCGKKQSTDFEKGFTRTAEFFSSHEDMYLKSSH